MLLVGLTIAGLMPEIMNYEFERASSQGSGC